MTDLLNKCSQRYGKKRGVMVIAYNGGSQNCSNVQDLIEVLNIRDEGNCNEFWLSEEYEKNPTLAILVCGGNAFLTYFPEEGHPGFQSLNANGDADEVTDFDIFEISGEYVVSFSLTVKAAQEFYERQELPTCLEWEEL